MAAGAAAANRVAPGGPENHRGNRRGQCGANEQRIRGGQQPTGRIDPLVFWKETSSLLSHEVPLPPVPSTRLPAWLSQHTPLASADHGGPPALLSLGSSRSTQWASCWTVPCPRDTASPYFKPSFWGSLLRTPPFLPPPKCGAGPPSCRRVWCCSSYADGVPCPRPAPAHLNFPARARHTVGLHEYLLNEYTCIQIQEMRRKNSRRKW